MIRLSTVVWFAVIVVAAFGLYMVKYEVQSLQEEIASLSLQLEEEKNAMHILSAEWAYLNRPDRLQALNDKYLQANPLLGEQMLDLVSVPYPIAPEASPVQPASLQGAAP